MSAFTGMHDSDTETDEPDLGIESFETQEEMIRASGRRKRTRFILLDEEPRENKIAPCRKVKFIFPDRTEFRTKFRPAPGFYETTKIKIVKATVAAYLKSNGVGVELAFDDEFNKYMKTVEWREVASLAVQGICVDVSSTGDVDFNCQILNHLYNDTLKLTTVLILGKTYLVKNLVAEAFLKHKPSLKYVLHTKDGNYKNCARDNLVIKSKSEVMHEAIRELHGWKKDKKVELRYVDTEARITIYPTVARCSKELCISHADIKDACEKNLRLISVNLWKPFTLKLISR